MSVTSGRKHSLISAGRGRTSGSRQLTMCSSETTVSWQPTWPQISGVLNPHKHSSRWITHSTQTCSKTSCHRKSSTNYSISLKTCRGKTMKFGTRCCRSILTIWACRSWHRMRRGMRDSWMDRTARFRANWTPLLVRRLQKRLKARLLHQECSRRNQWTLKARSSLIGSKDAKTRGPPLGSGKLAPVLLALAAPARIALSDSSHNHFSCLTNSMF